MHTAFAAFICATMLTVATAVFAPKLAHAAESNNIQAARTASDEECAAFLRRDPEALARLWSDDFVVTNPLNKFVRKQDVLRMMRSGVLVITSMSRHIEYAKEYGDLVILAGAETVTWGGAMPNAGRSESLRFTAIWTKQQGRWVEVARHANIVPKS